MIRRVGLIWLLVACFVMSPVILRAQTSTKKTANTSTGKSSSSSSSSRRSLSSSSTNSNNSNNNNSNSSNAFSTSRNTARTTARQDTAKKAAEEKKKANETKKKAEEAKKKAVSSSSKSSGASKAPSKDNKQGSLAPFTIKPNEAANILSLELASAQPTMNILVRKDQVFPTRVMFRSGGMEEFDSIDISLKYDPRILEPQGLDDKAFASRLSEPALARVDRKKGIIAWHAKFAQPTVVTQSEVFRIAWKPVALSDKTTIEFMNNPDYPSRVMRGRRNLLLPLNPEGAELGDEDLSSERVGLLGADVIVVTDLVTDEAADGTSGTAIVTTVGSSVLKLARDIEEGTAVGNMRMDMRSSVAMPTIGQDFIVSVGYSNPNMVEWDRVRFTLNFDPKVLQVVDWDQGNWITQGTNVYDGDLHDELPFDVHLKNQVMNNMGSIYYENAFTNRPVAAERGLIARIRFRPIRETSLTSIKFEQIDGDDTVQSPTSMTFLRYNLVGESGRRAASYGSLTFNIAGGAQR